MVRGDPTIRGEGRERENTCALSHARTHALPREKHLIRRRAYRRERRDYFGGWRVRGVDENVTLRENYVGGRESARVGVPLVN